MSSTFTYQFDTATYKGFSTLNTGLFIDGEFVDPVEKGTIDVVNPANGKFITQISAGTHLDIEIAVQAAKKAYKEHWGLKVSGDERAKLLHKLADLVEANADELGALEALNNGKTYHFARNIDVTACTKILRYYAGWADKIHGKTIQTKDDKLAYTRHEPIGVVGAIIPWNFPLVMLVCKIAPALATGNTIVLKPSELTPLSALRFCPLINEAGFPPGVVNVVNGFGHTVGQAIAENMTIGQVTFTGSTATGRKIMEAAAKSNLKPVSLELGGKSPSIFFDDVDVDQAVKWAALGVLQVTVHDSYCAYTDRLGSYNHGQVCFAGSRIYVHEKIYDEFINKFAEHARSLKLGDPFEPTTYQGPQVSQGQYDCIMGYIESGKQEGATLCTGGDRFGDEGYFINPTIFTDCKPHMKIVKEEIFGPVATVMKFSTEEEVIELANDTSYGLAGSVFTPNIDRALRVAHQLEAGTAWVNCLNTSEMGMPFGGFKQSGIGRELGEYALEHYTNVKAVHVNLGMRL
ncbi:putative 1-pyrroline-5-carboxylate dehydrogenase [Hygrophoropsis aurantiaca]|uniref:1-pyrroline-5-carboxylate dehydrogenase n=1 Tax=Hygrophoropsis aurantiaca TaxID=72124 RepID=A0ACB8A4X5_9AGAM|nr:putative 1-pyrroline-5-carboxylate dehydrogenase [Hygrophoropsis aurantiaca]